MSSAEPARDFCDRRAAVQCGSQSDFGADGGVSSRAGGRGEHGFGNAVLTAFVDDDFIQRSVDGHGFELFQDGVGPHVVA